MTDEAIIKQFLEQHPEHWDGVKRATFAYHLNHREPGAHYFSGSQRDAPCRWCGLTREAVRWGDGVPECSARPKWADESIGGVIAREEALFEKVWARAAEIAAKTDMTNLTGEDLSHLHHTHGIDPSMLEVALMDLGRSLPQHLHDEYQRAYEAHCATGKLGLKREIVIAR